jgi:hypothetical protein
VRAARLSFLLALVLAAATVLAAAAGRAGIRTAYGPPITLTAAGPPPSSRLRLPPPYLTPVPPEELNHLRT